MQKAVFLDRDGTLIDDSVFINTAEQMKLVAFLPGSIGILHALQQCGYQLYIVTNQGGVARGFFSEFELFRMHTILWLRLSKLGINIKLIRACMHDPDAGCMCRKPKPGMLFNLASQFHIDLASSIMIGNEEKDIAAGQAAGCKSYLIRGFEGWGLLDLYRPEPLLCDQPSPPPPAGTPRETQSNAPDEPCRVP